MKTPHFFHQTQKEKQNQQIITSLVVLRVGGAEGRVRSPRPIFWLSERAPIQMDYNLPQKLHPTTKVPSTCN